MYYKDELLSAIERGQRNFIILIGKGDGCDYTIGCNLSIIPLKDREGHGRIPDEILNDFGEDRIEEIIILRDVDIERVDVAALKASRLKRRVLAAEAELEEKERAEFDRLKKKFGE